MEDLKPAISTELNFNDLSPEEFQQMLAFWFEEKGIVADLKSHVKYQMINVLKNTIIGKNIAKKVSSGNVSLSQQALHLIVAEYLLQNQCHYTLSLFSNEVNLTKLLPDSALFYNVGDKAKEAKTFDRQNLINILEVIGISKTSEECKKLLDLYFSNDMSRTLLMCLVNVVSKSSQQDNGSNVYELDVDLEDDFMKKIAQILLSADLPQAVYTKILLEIKLCYELKTKFFESQCVELINKFKKELDLRDRKIIQHNRQKRKLEKKLKEIEKREEKLQEKLGNSTKDAEDMTVVKCNLDHCMDRCVNSEVLRRFKKENENLENENKSQKAEIQKLHLNYCQLKDELTHYKTKINLLNLKIQENEDVQKDGNIAYKDLSPSSEESPHTLTEEILREARIKLKQLEQESEEIELKCRSFIMK